MAEILEKALPYKNFRFVTLSLKKEKNVIY